MTACPSTCSLSPSSLPSYVPGEPPLYSCPLRGGEQRLQESPRVPSSLRIPSGTYVKQAGNITITLFDQYEDTPVPTYGRGAAIGGAVTLPERDGVIEIVVKVQGKLETPASTTTRLFESVYTLWNRKKNQDVCPGFFPFSCVLPTTSISGSPLPPSYDVMYPGIPSLFFKCKYSICFYIKFIRSHTLDLLTGTKRINIPFQYLPRARADRPIVYTPFFHSSVKTLPEEWHQVVSPIPPRPGMELEPLHCQFFIPSSRVYGIRDKIPFHIQLTGSLASLRKFLRPPEPEPEDLASSASTKKAPLKRLCGHPKANFTVSILRQTTLDTPYSAVRRNAIIGGGPARQVAPPFSGCPLRRDGELHLDWEGEVQVNADVEVGSFSVSDVSVNDHIFLKVDPLSREREPPVFLQVSIAVPVRLVTDSYVEEVELL